MIATDLYLRAREKEGRLFPDEVVRRLPDLPVGHPLRAEWRLRAASCARLARYLRGLPPPLAVLDLGCGNGWLANRLAQIPQARVWGADPNLVELAQARRVFSRPGLTFLAAGAPHLPFPPCAFDVIVLASVIQYFPDLPGLLHSLRILLKPGGEIHLLDSPLYAEEELPAARQRTLAYYQALGCPEMAAYYHHHTAAAPEPFSPRWLYRPEALSARLARRFGRAAPPFPWVILR